jgi:hypothetical protein
LGHKPDGYNEMKPKMLYIIVQDDHLVACVHDKTAFLRTIIELLKMFL